MKKTLLLIAIGALVSNTGSSQCSPEPSATLVKTLPTTSGTDNRSGVAYNPNFELYYSVNAGSSGYPVETYDAAGNVVNSVAQGFDYRGLWWNPNQDSLEGNGYGSVGVSGHQLDPSTGHALGSVTVHYTGMNQPDQQSCGDYDYDADEIIYYSSGSIYRYDHATGTSLGNYPLNSIPSSTADLNSNTVFYTGCTGNEIGVYNHVAKEVYYFDKATGNYSATTTLPGTAPAASSFKMSYTADGIIWLYNGPASEWEGYSLLPCAMADTAAVNDFVSDTLCLQGGLVPLPAATPSGGTYSGPGIVGQDFDAGTAGVGTHTIVYTYSDTSGCTSEDSAIVTVVDCSSIKDYISNENISVIPNPNNGQFTVQVSGTNADQIFIEVMNSVGQIIDSRKIAKGNVTEDFDLSNLSTGIYFVKVGTGHNYAVEKIVIR